MIGQSLSVALAGAVFASLGGSEAGNQLVAARAQGQPLAPDRLATLQQTFTHAFQAALLVSAIVAATGILAALVRGDESGGRAGPVRRERRGEPSPPREAARVGPRAEVL